MTQLARAQKFIDRKLIFQLRIFLGISVGLGALIIWKVAAGDLSPWLAILGVGLGLAVGYLLGRMLTIAWHETEAKAVSRMDIAGGLALAAFIGLDLSRNWIFGHWLHGAALGAFTLAVLAGALFGRFLGLRISIRQVLRSQRENR